MFQLTTIYLSMEQLQQCFISQRGKSWNKYNTNVVSFFLQKKNQITGIYLGTCVVNLSFLFSTCACMCSQHLPLQSSAAINKMILPTVNINKIRIKALAIVFFPMLGGSGSANAGIST